MMKRFSLLSVLMLVFMIGACGFTPLHSTNSDGTDSLNTSWRTTLFVNTIPEKIGQSLRNILIDNLTPKRIASADNIRYRMTVQQPKEERVSIGVDRESEATTRVQVLMTTKFKVIDNETKDVLLDSSARGFVSYNVLDSQFESIISRRDATDRALNLLANDIMRQTSLYFNKSNQTKGGNQ